MATQSRSNDIVVNWSDGDVEFRHTQPRIQARNTPPLACGSQMWLMPFVLLALIVFAPIYVVLHPRRAWREITEYSRGQKNG